jgi:hypothetical protein
MNKLLLSLSLSLLAFSSSAQTISTFEALSLPKADTAYVNYSKFGKDVGFSDGLAYFPCVYDTSFGFEFWASGFAYSNMRDSVTSGFMNQYSAKTAKGFAGSSNYIVAYGTENKVFFNTLAIGKSVFGFYITNSTYAFNSMRSGDAFAKKFVAKDKDFFRLDVFGYRGGMLTKDSVSFYLADFRNADTTKNYIVRDWQWVDLAKIGKVDSLKFRLQSSDNGTFGMNTPAYFCIDNFITNETGLKISGPKAETDIKIYPNPATDVLYVSSSLSDVQQVFLSDFLGRRLDNFELKNETLNINTSYLASGIYYLTFKNGDQVTNARFVKQ